MLNILILIAAGILGILACNLIEIDKLNQANDGATNLKKYCQKNWASIGIAFCAVLAAVAGRTYVSGLEVAGKNLWLAIFSIGLSGKYVVEFIRTKTKNILDKAAPGN